MDVKKLKLNAGQFLKKYRYVALVLIIGLVFMLVPGQSQRSQDEEILDTQKLETEPLGVEETLSQILSKISGAGNVQVLLTLSKGEETIFQTDTHTTASSDSTTSQVDTVVVSDAERSQTGLIRQINPATYQGAIVVCQGADSPTVRLAIVDAVSKATGLGADRISVLKMK